MKIIPYKRVYDYLVIFIFKNSFKAGIFFKKTYTSFEKHESGIIFKVF